MNRFLRRLFGRNTVRAAQAKTGRLRLEALEDRRVPAGFNFGGLAYGSYIESLRQSATGFATVGESSVGADKPQLVAAGYFDGDAQRDLVVTNLDGTYSVLLGDGAGNFRLAFRDSAAGPTSYFAEGVVTGYFDGDSYTDIAIAYYGDPGEVVVLHGVGDGRFERLSSLQMLVDYNPYDGDPTPSRVAPTYLSAADLDQDGVSDLVVSDFNNNKVVIYRNDGGGAFQLHDWNYAPNGVLNPDQTVVADFNADGIPDVAVANFGNGTVSFLRGLGGGYVTSAGFVELGVAGSVGLAAGDLNGDGRIDLAVANYGTNANGSRTLSLLANLSGPGDVIAFAKAADYTLGDHLINVAVADFNGDGRADLAVTSAGNTQDDSTTDNRVYLLFNRDPSQFRFEQATFPLPTGRNPVGLIATDFDGDGDLDLVSANQASDTVSAFRNVTPRKTGGLVDVYRPGLRDRIIFA